MERIINDHLMIRHLCADDIAPIVAGEIAQGCTNRRLNKDGKYSGVVYYSKSKY